jgi:hypothetical protein
MAENDAEIEVEYLDEESGMLILYEEKGRLKPANGVLEYVTIEQTDYDYNEENFKKHVISVVIMIYMYVTCCK